MSLPRTPEEVEEWTAKLREERKTASGVAMVDAIERVALAFFVTQDPQIIAQLGNTLDKLLRALVAADRAAELAEIKRLAKLADRGEAMRRRLRGLN